jgi:putative redox protein
MQNARPDPIPSIPGPAGLPPLDTLHSFPRMRRRAMEKIEIYFPGGKRVDADFDGFTVKTDQTPANEGEGSAPAPFDYFLTSIGTCVGIYVLSFCQTRDIPVDDVKIIQTIHRNQETRVLDEIGLEIKLPSDFPAKYRRALVHAAELCAVKKTMEAPPAFTITTTMGSG